MRRIELGYGMSITGELAGTVALVVYALGVGGAALVAGYAACRTLAGMGVALVLTGLTSRLRRDRLLRWITGVRVVLLAAAALLAAFGQPPAAVIAAGAASSSLAGTYRPLQAAVLPWLVRTPAVLAVHVLALGGSAVGWLTAAFGAGGLAGGAVAAGAVRVTRLGRSFIAGLLLWGLPLVFLALTPAAALAYLALLVVGIGNAVVDVAAFPMVPRLAGPRPGGKVLGALEFVALAGLTAGSILTPQLLHALGVRGTLALLGGGLAGLALAHAVRFRRLDRAMPAPGPEVELLRNLPMFAPLPLAVIDLLAAEPGPRPFPARAGGMREGEAGDRFHLIVDGSAAVSVQGAPRPSLHRGDCFGEIALLRDIPRTATVTAEQPLRTLALSREDFLTAVTGNSASKAAADTLTAQRLSTDAPDRSDGPAHT